MLFKTPDGEDYTLEQICSLLDKNYEYEVYIGTDSQVHKSKRKVLYVTCIVLYRQSKGGRSFIFKEWERIPNSLRERLTNEVWRSLDTCFEVGKVFPANVEIVVDVDLNKKPQYKSSDYVQELVGMVMGQGFKCRTKPYAWAAMSVADRYSK
jgi:uncharacterized protein